jgi:hypothetical protein
MNNLFISTSKKLKNVKPSKVRRVGFFKLRKMYDYNFPVSDVFRRVSASNTGLTRLDKALLALSGGGAA